MKAIIKVMILATLILPIKPVYAKSKTLQEYIDKICVKNCVKATRLKKAVNRVAKRHKINPNLIIAVIKTESGFVKQANSKGNKGLMQINLNTHRDKITGENIFNVEDNIAVGSSILKDCLNKESFNIKKALVCYKGDDNTEYYAKVVSVLKLLNSLT